MAFQAMSWKARADSSVATSGLAVVVFLSSSILSVLPEEWEGLVTKINRRLCQDAKNFSQNENPKSSASELKSAIK